MKQRIISKTLTVAVILLVIGVGINPAIATVESDNSELEEITIQFYETDKTYNHTVMLTQEQIMELENLIDDFEIKIDNADNRLESEAIFKDTVLSFYEYGLLPEGMSIEKAQRLVTGKEHNPVLVKLFKRWYEKNHQSSYKVKENFLCLIAGKTDQTLFYSPIYSIFLNWLGQFGGYPTPYWVTYLFLFSLYGYAAYLLFFPFAFTHYIIIGDDVYPADGFIITIGLNGIKVLRGSLYGQIPMPQNLFDLGGSLGVIGFTGIKIYHDYADDLYDSKVFYLGTALWVKIKKVYQ